MTAPTKPTDDRRRILRGGSLNHRSDIFVRAAHRTGNTPLGRYEIVGFRTIQSGCRQQVLKGMTPP